MRRLGHAVFSRCHPATSQLSMLMAEEDEANETDDDDDDDDDEEGNLFSRFGYGWPLPTLEALSLDEADTLSRGHTLASEGSMCSALAPGLLLTSCNHPAHLACWQEYMAGLLRRVAQQESFEGEGLVRPQRGEFLCPVCRGVSNVLLPLSPFDECGECSVGEGNVASTLSRAASEKDDSVVWAEEMIIKLETIRERPPLVAEHEVELRQQLDDFQTFCTCMQGKLPQMSIDPSDSRARHMPAALLAHNSAVAELLSRSPSLSTENDTMRLKLRALWTISQSSFPNLSTVTTFLLHLCAQRPLHGDKAALLAPEDGESAASKPR